MFKHLLKQWELYVNLCTTTPNFNIYQLQTILKKDKLSFSMGAVGPKRTVLLTGMMSVSDCCPCTDFA